MASSISYETTARGYKVAYSVPDSFFGSEHCASCAAGGDAVVMDAEHGECPRCGSFQNYRRYECCESCDREWHAALDAARQTSSAAVAEEEAKEAEWSFEDMTTEELREQLNECDEERKLLSRRMRARGAAGATAEQEEQMERMDSWAVVAFAELLRRLEKERDEAGVPAPDLSFGEPVPGAEEELSGVHIVTLGDGRKVLSGNTFRFREQIKAASLASPSGLAAGWDPAEKTWTVAKGTDLAFLRPAPGAPKKPRLPFRGACCSEAHQEIDAEIPQGPMRIVCAAHGSQRGSYDGS